MKRRKTINGTLLLDVRAASAFLGCSERSLRGMVARQQVPYRKLNSRVVFIKTQLVQFVNGLPGVSVEEVRATAERR